MPLATEVDSDKYFPVSNSGKEVRDRLLSSCLERGVKLHSGAGCSNLQRKGSSGWDVELAKGVPHEAERVVCPACSHLLNLIYPPKVASYRPGGEFAKVSASRLAGQCGFESAGCMQLHWPIAPRQASACSIHADLVGQTSCSPPSIHAVGHKLNK